MSLMLRMPAVDCRRLIASDCRRRKVGGWFSQTRPSPLICGRATTSISSRTRSEHAPPQKIRSANVHTSFGKMPKSPKGRTTSGTRPKLNLKPTSRETNWIPRSRCRNSQGVGDTSSGAFGNWIFTRSTRERNLIASSNVKASVADRCAARLPIARRSSRTPAVA